MEIWVRMQFPDDEVQKCSISAGFKFFLFYFYFKSVYYCACRAVALCQHTTVCVRYNNLLLRARLREGSRRYIQDGAIEAPMSSSELEERKGRVRTMLTTEVTFYDYADRRLELTREREENEGGGI